MACARAIAACERDESVRNPDYLARQFLNRWWRICFHLGWITRRVMEIGSPGIYCYHIARTKHIDSLLIQVLKEGVEQLVILGAGNDSRAYRFCSRLGRVPVFEVDFPGTQAEKKSQLLKFFGHLPENVTFVPIDFNSQSLEEVLLRGGFKTTLKTFFIWEGVSYYISEGAVDRVLQFVTDNCLPGSSLVFDYALQSFIRGDWRAFRGARATKICAAAIGEPLIFGIEDGSTEQFLRERGLKTISDLGPYDLEGRYLLRSDGTLHGHAYDFFRIVHATVNRAGHD